MTRCFTYISDAIDCVLKSFNSTKSDTKTFNIGNKTEVSIADLISYAIKLHNGNAKVKKINTRKKYGEKYQDIQRRVPNVEYARKILRWRAKISYKEGIIKTLNWYLNKS